MYFSIISCRGGLLQRAQSQECKSTRQLLSAEHSSQLERTNQNKQNKSKQLKTINCLNTNPVLGFCSLVTGETVGALSAGGMRGESLSFLNIPSDKDAVGDVTPSKGEGLAKWLKSPLSPHFRFQQSQPWGETRRQIPLQTI